MRWSRQLADSLADVVTVDVSADGSRLAVVRRDGQITVLTGSEGKTIATIQVELHNPDVDSVALIDDGQYIAVQSRTQSGVVPWTVAVYPVKDGAKVSYRNQGTAVHFSPYHDIVLGLQASETPGIAVMSSTGDLGFIPYEYEVQVERVELASSADGQLFYVWSAKRGLTVYDRSLKNVFHLDATRFKDFKLAPVTRIIAHTPTPGRLELLGNNGSISALSYDSSKVAFGSLMPAGEPIFVVKDGTRQADCVVNGNGKVIGCFPSVEFGAAAEDGRSFFWAYLDDGTLAAYLP